MDKPLVDLRPALSLPGCVTGTGEPAATIPQAGDSSHAKANIEADPCGSRPSPSVIAWNPRPIATTGDRSRRAGGRLPSRRQLPRRDSDTAVVDEAPRHSPSIRCRWPSGARVLLFFIYQIIIGQEHTLPRLGRRVSSCSCGVGTSTSPSCCRRSCHLASNDDRALSGGARLPVHVVGTRGRTFTTSTTGILEH